MKWSQRYAIVVACSVLLLAVTAISCRKHKMGIIIKQ
jgi:hypothetical protein